MYSREDIVNRNFGDEDEDEDDDNEVDFPSDLVCIQVLFSLNWFIKNKRPSDPSDLERRLQGKHVKEKQTKKVDWKQKMAKGIVDAGEAVKKHATKVSYKLNKWWRAKKKELEETYKTSKAEL